jgi:hypothetical protein
MNQLLLKVTDLKTANITIAWLYIHFILLIFKLRVVRNFLD